MSYTPNIGSAQGDAFTGRLVEGPDPGAYRPGYLDAPYLPYELQNELLGDWGAQVGMIQYRQLFTCGSGDYVGCAVRLIDSNTVSIALGDDEGHIQCIGFIRNKPSPTTCYICHYYFITGLSGGTYGTPIFLADDGSYSITPGTYAKMVGIFLSATTGYLNISPISAVEVPSYQRIESFTPIDITNSGEWEDVSPITLNPSFTYEITAQMNFQYGAATPLQMGLALSIYSGNVVTDHVTGDNVFFGLPPTADSLSSLSIVSYRVHGVSTLYCKVYSDFSSTAVPNYVGNIIVKQI